MKIQNLAVIFIIIILPISLLLSSYVQNQVKTLGLQVSYDTKLTNATYDALKAFQLNTANSSTSDLANSKLRDIEASVNTFYNSVSTNFNMAGYNKDVLRDYVPALVYTMYDGYYIYSSFTNTLQDEDVGTTYTNGEKISGLKPYVHYSCRYVKDNIDVVITYSLDNYITVEGTIGNTPVYKYGYLLDNITGSGNSIQYRGVSIGIENNLKENVVYLDDSNNVVQSKDCNYIKINGLKYYRDSSGTWFTVTNGKRTNQPGVNFVTNNNSAIRYYNEASDFTSWVKTNLKNLTPRDAVDESGNKSLMNIKDSDGNPIVGGEFNANYAIFGDNQNGGSIEDPNSYFNQQRLAVIRYSIEKNLSIAIANYNKFTNVTANFQMPELREDEWEKIINNVSIISFMQGLSIGGKIYNGYSIVTNTKTEEVVNTDSIYIVTSDGQYHRATDSDLIGNSNIQGAYFNVDFERKSLSSGNDDDSINFYPQVELGCYGSIVNQTNVNDLDSYNGSIYKYMEEIAKNGGTKLAQTYFTALGRERYSMYKTNNNPDQLKSLFNSTP